jgi:hypothetical protein
MKDHYSENFKTMMKEIKEDTKNGKTSHVHRLKVLLNCPYNPK